MRIYFHFNYYTVVVKLSIYVGGDVLCNYGVLCDPLLTSNIEYKHMKSLFLHIQM